MAHADGDLAPSPTDHRGRLLEDPSARGGRPAAPAWLWWCSIATSLGVLASHLVYIAGLVRAGVGWTDGARAYGVEAETVLDVLPPGGLRQALALVTVLAVLLGPWAAAGLTAAAATSMWRSRGQRQNRFAIATMALVLVLLVLLVVWGDELWIWMLD